MLLCTVSITLSGCGIIPGVYKIDVQQGNVVTQDMVDQLRPGMTQRQVRFIMGTPLIQDTFHPERWDYLYSLKSGRSDRVQERISLNFDDNRLVGLSGDFVPGASTDEEIMGGQQNSETESYPVDLGAPLGTGE
ncbi:outer membrane protein assembly factor BamE [Pseudomonas neustonica]|uniref:Outer membrane protein assembly factor BamE n=1 Tax=Pseudomonas neustonica TaxID=2487346 RepID=A0ABX9XGH1_9PSED|nr:MULTISPECIES: outer membrane protein assembly factor BamE [Pseudomonas]MBA6420137.1 outer membrane protein assembly factor BamE [Pseudomonas sp. 5Ae-yellow]ROZ81778.1 outer membrane protein assembly factor BamE [Pseudomonas sp. SSM44]ROZ83621.1 outer membrane protein assembly factor BamE [Pseudomonas neustonica]|tara:strand:+ start:382 stop:783 length:402 start_codon:yes stop_codon:yes gene_type:complete